MNDLRTFLLGALRWLGVLLAWVSELSRMLRAQGGWVMANAVSLPYPFAASVLAIHGYE